MQNSEKLHTIYVKPEAGVLNDPEALVVRRRTDIHLADTALNRTVRTRLDVLDDDRESIIDSRPETD
jgi:hypothetical protein